MSHHPVDLLSLVSGSLVLGVGLLLLSGGLGHVSLAWVGPAAAVGLGVVIVLAARPAGRPNEYEPDPIAER